MSRGQEVEPFVLIKGVAYLHGDERGWFGPTSISAHGNRILYRSDQAEVIVGSPLGVDYLKTEAMRKSSSPGGAGNATTHVARRDMHTCEDEEGSGGSPLGVR